MIENDSIKRMIQSNPENVLVLGSIRKLPPELANDSFLTRQHIFDLLDSSQTHSSDDRLAENQRNIITN